MDNSTTTIGFLLLLAAMYGYARYKMGRKELSAHNTKRESYGLSPVKSVTKHSVAELKREAVETVV